MATNYFRAKTTGPAIGSVTPQTAAEVFECIAKELSVAIIFRLAFRLRFETNSASICSIKIMSEGARIVGVVAFVDTSVRRVEGDMIAGAGIAG